MLRIQVPPDRRTRAVSSSRSDRQERDVPRRGRPNLTPSGVSTAVQSSISGAFLRIRCEGGRPNLRRSQSSASMPESLPEIRRNVGWVEEAKQVRQHGYVLGTTGRDTEAWK